MSRLSVRRVWIQELDEHGSLNGKMSFGIMASNDNEARFNDSFESIDALNNEIRERGCILELIEESDAFRGIDRSLIGTDNFYGKIPYKDGEE